MMLPSHFLAALAVGSLWGRARRRSFAPREWALALGFSVAIDLDHTLQFPAYVATHGLTGLTASSMLHWGASWQGFMHAPSAALIAGGVSVLALSPIPLAFWGLHMFQDFVIAERFVVFGSLEEWVIVGALALAVSWLFASDRKREMPEASMREFLVARFGLGRLLRSRARLVQPLDADEA